MKKFLFLLINCLFFPASVHAQVKIDSIFIYEYFVDKGFTTAGISSQFRELKEKKTSLIKVGDEETIQLNRLLENAICKKHYQTKFGGEGLFCQVYTNGKPLDFHISLYVITDMSNYKNYWIKNEHDRKKIDTFLKKFKL